MLAFSTSDDIVRKKLNVTLQRVTDIAELPQVYEVDRCAKWIQEHNFIKVGLQFPDHLLVAAASVVSSLQELVTADIFILGDTSYGSCCVDETAGEHYQADCIIHYGPACLSPTQRLPVLYIFCSQPVDIRHAAQQLQTLCPDYNKPVILMADTRYHHALDPLHAILRGKYNMLLTSDLNIPDFGPGRGAECKQTNTKLTSVTIDAETKIFLKCSRHFDLPSAVPLKECTVFFIGQDALTLANLMMTMRDCAFVTYDPVTQVCRQEILQVNKTLMKRYYMIERAKDASIVGIVVGTLAVVGTLDIIARLKVLAKGAGKKCYTFVVGKLNVAKLANFMEVDVFVLVACPINTLLDSSEFYRPVVTPYEMEIACNDAREWTGDYLTDFRDLLPGSASYIEITAPASDATDVSLISNKLRRMGCISADDDDKESASMVLRSERMAVVATELDGEFLAQRSWQGLEWNLQDMPLQKAHEGRRGIATSYTHEAN